MVAYAGGGFFCGVMSFGGVGWAVSEGRRVNIKLRELSYLGPRVKNLRMQTSDKLRLPRASVWIIVLGSLLYGLPLARFPQFSSQEAFFAYQALKASRGGSLVYAASIHAPNAQQIWAYHGPVLPYLNELLFRLFGFSTLLSRLPDFIGGWLAALLVVLFLNKKGFRYAGFVFAVLWCGSYTTRLLDLGRMEGLALLVLALSFIALDHALATGKSRSFVICGIAAGFAVLVNPICVLFAIADLSLAWLLGARKAILLFIAGVVLCGPLLLLMWHFRVRASWQQFRWHTEHLRNHNHKQALLDFMHLVPNLDKAWVVGLAIFALVTAFVAIAVVWKRKGDLDLDDRTIVIATGLGFAGLVAFCVGPMFPYYLVCFLVWPMLCVSMLAEKYRVRFQVAAVILGSFWVLSAADSAHQLLNEARTYRSFNKQLLYQTVHDNVPAGSVIETTPRYYGTPLHAGLTRFGLTTWFTEDEDACPSCYLLMSEPEFTGVRVLKANVAQRKILYDGPAFPTAHVQKYPFVLLSPKVLPSGAFRSDGPPPN